MTAEGPRVYLRPLNIADATVRYCNWLNNPEVNRYLESRFAVHTLDTVRAFVNRAAQDPDVLFLAIVRKEDGLHIGNLKIGPIDRHHFLADMGILIGEKSCWGQRYATEAISVGTEYMFREVNLHKLTAGAYEKNTGVVKAFLNAGYTVEGRLLQHYWTGDEYVDRICFGKINENFRIPQDRAK